MTSRKVLLTATIMCAVGLTACSGQESDTAQRPQQELAASPAIDCANASQSEWMEHCATVEPVYEEPDPKPFGEPFEFTSFYADGPGTDWLITLEKVDCGLANVPRAELNPNYDYSAPDTESNPHYSAVEPEPGNQFCILQWNWENVGTKPGYPTHSGNIRVGDEEFAQTDDDASRSWTIMDTHLDITYTDIVNPRGSMKTLDIYQIPEGEEPTAVWFPMATFVSESEVLVATTTGL